MCFHVHIWWIWLGLLIERYLQSIRKLCGTVVCSKPRGSSCIAFLVLGEYVNIILICIFRASRSYGFCPGTAINSWSSRRSWSDDILSYNCNSCPDGKQSWLNFYTDYNDSLFIITVFAFQSVQCLSIGWFC